MRNRAPHVEAARSVAHGEASAVATRLTMIPASATTVTTPPCTAPGWISRRIATDREPHREQKERDAVCLAGQGVHPCEAVGISAPRAGRWAIFAATTATSRAAASVTMWPASLSRTSECASSPATISPTMNATTTTRAASQPAPIGIDSRGRTAGR